MKYLSKNTARGFSLATLMAIFFSPSVFAINGYDSSFSMPSNLSVITGSQVKVPVGLNTDGSDIIRAELAIRYDRTKLDIVDILPQTSNSSLSQFLPKNSAGAFDKSTVIANAQSTGIIKFRARGSTPFRGALDFSRPLVYLIFKAKTAGSSAVTFIDLSVPSGDSSLIEYRTGDDILSWTYNLTVKIDTAAPSPTPTPTPSPTPTGSPIYIPAQKTSWQWQLTGTVDTRVNAEMFDIDLFDNSASVVAELHAQNKKVVCYFSAGSYENWRPDASRFPAEVLGKSNGWPGERWLDIRRIDLLKPIMESRMDLCKTKGFDAIEPDNIDGYTNSTGFPLSYQDQINYNKFLAQAAHARGMSIGLKNDMDQAKDLLSDFDWALNEQCFQYNECDTLLPFIRAGKAVFHVEYDLNTSQFCSKANSMNFNSLKKNLNLDAAREACR